MCSLQEADIFSVLSPHAKGQGWEHIGQVESVHVHCLGDALGPHLLHSWSYTLDCWSHHTGCGSRCAVVDYHGSLGNVCCWG